MKVRYAGPLEAVEVPVGDDVLVVGRGKTVEVPDELGQRLLQQDVWEESPRAKTKED